MVLQTYFKAISPTQGIADIRKKYKRTIPVTTNFSVFSFGNFSVLLRWRRFAELSVFRIEGNEKSNISK